MGLAGSPGRRAARKQAPVGHPHHEHGCSPDQLRWFSLTFPDERTEAEFLRASKAAVLECLGYVGILLLLISFFRLVLALIVSDLDDSPYPGFVTDLFIIWGVIVFSSILLVIVCKTPSLSRRLSPLAVEAMSVVFSLMLLSSALTSIHTLASLKGYTVSGCSHDAGLVLHMIGIILGVQIVPPIRWLTTCPTQLFALFGFALHTFFLGGEDCTELEAVDIHGARRSQLLITLFFVMLGVSKGKRNAEVQARELFTRVIKERTHRASTEFQLERLQRATSASVKPLRQPSLPDSIPCSTSTARIFDVIDIEAGGGAQQQQLAAVAALGREEHWLIEPSELTWSPLEILGKGGYGVVVTATYLGMTVALKVPNNPPGATGNRSLFNELSILRRICHPNIVAFYGACLDAEFTDLALVMEFVRGATLRDFIRQRPNSAQRARILQETSGALCYLHAHHPRIVHGDLKDTNILVQQEEQDGERRWASVKLLDFGLARQITKCARPMGGTNQWMAPEVADAAVPGTPADVYSLGRVAFFVVTDMYPTSSPVKQTRAGAEDAIRWPAVDALRGRYRDIINRCNAVDPLLRPPIDEVHLTFMANWRKCTNKAGAALDLDLHAELQAVRRAADKLVHHPPERQRRVDEAAV